MQPVLHELLCLSDGLFAGVAESENLVRHCGCCQTVRVAGPVGIETSNGDTTCDNPLCAMSQLENEKGSRSVVNLISWQFSETRIGQHAQLWSRGESRFTRLRGPPCT